MEGFSGNGNGDLPLSRAVTFRYSASGSLPAAAAAAAAAETSSLHDQLFYLQRNSSLASSPFDLQTLEYGISRLGISDLNNFRRANDDYTNGSSIDNINNQRISGGEYGFSHYSLHKTENERINHLQWLIFQNNCDSGSFGYEDYVRSTFMGSTHGSNNDLLNDSSHFSTSSRNGFLDRRTWVSSNAYMPGNHNGLRNSVMSNRRHDNSVAYPTDSVKLENLTGMVLYLAKDRCYSQLLQQIIVEGSREKINMIFYELIRNVGELMVDHFGHHVVQKLLEKCSQEQISQILSLVTSDCFQLINICTDSHGYSTRAVQALLRSLRSQEQISRAMGALSLVAVPLTKSNNGHHVIQYCLKYFSPKDNVNLLEKVAQNCYEIATDQHGCCILQLCIADCAGEPRQLMVGPIIANSLRLAEHLYGNYLVQYLLELKDPRITEDVLRQLRGNYGSLSRNKYGSHVVQKCLIELGEEHSRRIIVELLRDINMLLIDPFGNYVMQSALMVSKDGIREILQLCVKENAAKMQGNKYGRKVLERLSHLV